QELPLVFQDKIFVGPATKITDPEWYTSLNLQPITQQDGSLWYAHVYDTTRWDRIASTFNLPNPSAIPEFFGDTMLVNGTVFPQAAVQARRYRFRMLNACNARFLNLQLYIDDGSLNGITLNANGVPTNTPLINAATGDSSWLQIGTEGGFLSSPKKVASNIPFQINDPDFLAGGASLNPALVAKSLLVAPAERPDVIIDFSSVPKNPDGTYKNIILYNDAASPFPVGDDRNDYFPGWNVGDGVDGVGNPVNGTTAAGFGPNTRVLMRFKVVAPTGTADAPLTISAANFAAHIDPTYPGAPWGTTDTTTLPYKVRKITLNEYHDEFGRLIQILGNEDPNNPNAIFGTPYDGTATYLDYPPTGTPATVGATEEHVNAGDTEIWEVYNATGDVHPMHFHLVNVQLLNREVFDPAIFPYVGTGTFIPPADNELGWKETVPMYPGTITRAIMKFDISQAKIFDKNMNPLNVTPSLPGQLPIVNGNPPVSPRTGGYEYVWHCHILEHEEHDMMHSLVVAPPVP
ncbi:MAG TPA: multicopper oxidase domain-containing protein, partial [Syntrophorhabdaceae bacterium]|nr:multicopper oxidase domain-containing protein [Syntrophorhabdaceae bacterium]